MSFVPQPIDVKLAFDNAAEVYDAARPSYPSELFDELFGLLPPQPHIVEVGPGTGKATKDLLARSASVHAVEIAPAMASRLRANLPSERLRISIGDFESMDIESGADAVFSATAYHWISRSAQTDRPAKILRLNGLMAIVELIQVESPHDLGFFAAVQPVYERYGQRHTGPPAPSRDAVDPALRAVLEADSRFGSVTVRKWDWNQTYSAPGYVNLMLSFSGTQMMDERSRRGLLRDMEAFIQTEFAGQVTRPLVVTLTTAFFAGPRPELRVPTVARLGRT
jgi:trans-aconitate methyltransferase